MCKKLPVECPDGCGTIVAREKVKNIMKIDTDCPQILSSRGAVKSPIYDLVEQQHKSQEGMICKLNLIYPLHTHCVRWNAKVFI